MQDKLFLEGEGDRYHERNRHKYAGMIEKDPVLKAIECTGITPKHVLEIGCATGWRLNELVERYDAQCHGLEASNAAIRTGLIEYPLLSFCHGTLPNLELVTGYYDLIILSFVLHWVDRTNLLPFLADVDRLLRDGGYLVISDFWPMMPHKVPYKHADGIYTYKADYASIFRGWGRYRAIDVRLFDADTLEPGGTHVDRQGRCCLFQKGDFYA